jgi:hypothetical protein
MFAIIRVILATLLFFLLAPIALAHDHNGNPLPPRHPQQWIEEGKYTSKHPNPHAGAHCCGKGDCSWIEPAFVLRLPGGGYRSEFAGLIYDWAPGEAYEESEDGKYHICINTSTKTPRCLFVPPLGA